MGYYKDLTFDERQKITSAYVGLKLNKGKEGISMSEAMGAVNRAIGRPLQQSDYRDTSVNMLLSLVKPKKRI